MKRVAFLTSIVVLISLSLAAPVLAAAPGNDAYLRREVIGLLPFSASGDTTAATTDADDVEANASCGALPSVLMSCMVTPSLPDDDWADHRLREERAGKG